MTTENKSRFMVINGGKENTTEKHAERLSYTTNPLKERLVKFKNIQDNKRFSVEDWI